MARLQSMICLGLMRGSVLSVDGEACFGSDEVDDGEEVVAMEHVVYLGSHGVGELEEYALYLLAFLTFEFAYLVVCLNDFCRFDVDGFAGVGFVVDDAAYLALEGWGYRDDESSVAECGCYVVVDESVGLR